MKNLYLWCFAISFIFGSCAAYWEQFEKTNNQQYHVIEDEKLPPQRDVVDYDPIRAETMPYAYKNNTYKSTKDTIYLYNPSFEDIPRCCEAPKGWFSYGFLGETAPDVQPGSFGVNLLASDLETYVSMVVRDNGTNEALTQKLPLPLKANQNYTFSLDLARSPTLYSLSRTTGEELNYNNSVKLKLGGTSAINDEFETLATSIIIENTTWKSYSFTFTPSVDMSYIILMADWGILSGTNGNILMDNCSPIVRITTEK